MKIAKLRNKPFLLLALQDGTERGVYSEEFIGKLTQQLTDMSLRIASDHYTIVYADHVTKSCEIVLGLCNLGLLSLSANDTDKAIEIIKDKGIVFCFRAGWAKYQSISKISNTYFKSLHISDYAQKTDDVSDIQKTHNEHENMANKNKKFVEVYNFLNMKYGPTRVINQPYDESIFDNEMQMYANSAVSLLFIDCSNTRFNANDYSEFNRLRMSIDVPELESKLESAIQKFTSSIPLSIKIFLEDNGFLQFKELKQSIYDKVSDDIFTAILEISMDIQTDGAFSEEYDEDPSSFTLNDIDFIDLENFQDTE